MTMNPWVATRVMEAHNANLRRAAARQQPSSLSQRPAPRPRGRPSAVRLRLAGWLIRAGQRVAGPALQTEEVLALGAVAAGLTPPLEAG